MILLSESLWTAVIQVFQNDRTNCERVAYLDGLRVGASAAATTITIPAAERHPRYFRVSPEAMSKAGKHLMDYGLQRLAQVHSHGDAFLGHSETDDQAAYSQRPGSISIVVPFHGRRTPTIFDCGIHVRERDGWTQIKRTEIESYVLLVPTFVVPR